MIKTHPATSPDASRAAHLYRIAIVGAGSLRGKEVAEVLNDRNFPSLDVKLLDDDESMGQLEALGDEISFIQSLRSAEFGNVDFTFFTADAQCTRQNWTTARDAGSAIIDLSYALEDEPGVAVRSPWIERQLGNPSTPELQPAPAVIAHPASVVLAMLALRARKAGSVSRVVATVCEPASERGQKGMDELHEQTVNLLSFQQLPKKIFDTQIAFNMVARYGPNASTPLASIEERILRHYVRIGGSEAPRLSLTLVQAPIFHGHAFSIYVEMEKPLALADLKKAVAGEHVSLADGDEDSPSNVGAAGQGDALISLVADANNATGFWIWAAADNLRIAAATAVECAETMTSSRPRGKIQ
jgi:aspartate-semialdehyde dehydrogenase